VIGDTVVPEPEGKIDKGSVIYGRMKSFTHRRSCACRDWQSDVESDLEFVFPGARPKGWFSSESTFEPGVACHSASYQGGIH
jgi:hypothetical protein